MDAYAIVAGQFHRLMDHASTAVDGAADALGLAATQAAAAVAGEHKLLALGIGRDAATASLFSQLMQQGTDRERPPLPVYELSGGFGGQPEAGTEWLCQRVRALGQPGDVAVVFATDLRQHRRLADELAQRSVAAVWLGGTGSDALAFADADRATRLLMTCACALSLAQLIDLTLFGPMED